MQDNEFFLHCNLSSNIFNPEIKLDGKWEVAAYDLALGNDLPTTSTPIRGSEFTSQDYQMRRCRQLQ